jgi:methionine S-methyltransferase
MSLPTYNVDDFLARCSVSSNHCYEAFGEILAYLESPATRGAARSFLGLVLKETQQLSSHEKPPYFSFIKQPVLTYDSQTQQLDILTFRSTFTPDEWSYTFYEGLIRYPVSYFYGRTIVEMGSGNGWVVLALALRTMPKQVIGVDINPYAVLCAKLNTYLNSFDAEGDPLTDREQLTLLERVSFVQSDLLNYFFSHPLPIDRVIGCIPQVINPELDRVKDAFATTDDYLYALSNYYVNQGYIEDQFGLGLIARAVEQAIELLRPTGRLILNLGGRPGVAMLERLMTRRGLEVNRIWQTRVEQDPKTSITGLVEIERETGHRFEFFMSPHDNASITASTAYAYGTKGGKLYHSVSVYEGELVHPNYLQRIFKVLHQKQYDEVRSVLDLAEQDASIAEERFSFLANVLEYLDNLTYFPYANTSGEPKLLEQISAFFGLYHSVRFSLDQLLVAPSREEIVANILLLFDPSSVLIGGKERNLLPQDWRKGKYLERVVEAPANAALTTVLIEALCPNIVITSLQDFENKTEEVFLHLCDATARCGAWLVVDISEALVLSSEPPSIGILKALVNRRIPEHVFLLGGLLSNRVYTDLSLAFVVSPSPRENRGLRDLAELTYSRTPLLTQVFYGNLLYDLLYFQATRILPSVEQNQFSNDSLSKLPNKEFSENAVRAMAHPAIVGNYLPFDSNSVRLDYGENCLPSPLTLLRALVESFARKDITDFQADPRQALGAHLEHRYYIPSGEGSQLVLGNGVASLFDVLLQICKQEQRSLGFPSGVYGYFRAALDLHGVPCETLAVDERLGFKLSWSSLEKHLRDKAWLYFNAPVVNPTGVRYKPQELNDILIDCVRCGNTVIIDTVFGGLEFDEGGVRYDLSQVWELCKRSRYSGRVVVLGGVSKEFSAAGLRFGYVWSSSNQLLAEIERRLYTRPHRTICHAAKLLFEHLNNGDTQILSHLQKQREILALRAQRLVTTLQNNGWEPLKPQGGLFLVAKPVSYFGHSFEWQDKSWLLDGDSITEAIFYSTGLAINNATWTGLEGYCRFVLSTSDLEFEKSLHCIEQFYQLFKEEQP